MTAFELAGKLKLDSSEFTSSMGKQESAFKKFGNKIGNTAKTISKVVKASVVAGTVMVGKASVQEGLEFDKAMSQVAATLGKSKDDIQDLSKFAREMGSKTAFSATEAAQALNYMALAGYDSKKSMDMLPTVLNLAAAGGIDLAKASDMVTDAQSALGLSMEDTEKLVDKMAKTSSKTNTSVEQLGDAMLTIGGTAKAMGAGSIDTTTELSMALGVLADNGIKGAEGGTMLRNILLSLSAPTDAASKKLKELGINAFDSEGNMRDLPFLMQDIKNATQDMTQEERTDFLSEVFNKRDLKAIEAMLGTDISRWKSLYDEISSAEGSAEKMASTQLDNLAGDLTIFKSAVSEAKLSISDRLSPTLRKFVQRGTAWVGRLSDSFNKNGLSGAIKESRVMIRGLITESLGLGSDASWGNIGKAIGSRIKNGIKNAFDKVKIRLANMMGLTDSNGKAIDDPSDVSWINIAKAAVAKIKSEFVEYAGTSKVKLANLLGLTDENGNAVDDPSDVSWGSIARKAFDSIKEKFTGAAGTAKVKLANWLGLTDDSGNAIDDPSDTTWGSIGSKMLEKIKTGFSGAVGKTKVKLANWLGLTDDAGNAVDDPGDTSWSSVAEKIKEKLKGGFDTLKVKLSDLLGLTPEGVGEEVDWADIGKNILDKLTSYFSHKGDFLKKLVLGDEFTDQSTWLDVGTKISGWLEEAFADGGILNAILSNTTEKMTAIASFAGQLISGFATWMNQNSDQVVGIIVSLANAISEAAGPVITALGKILSDPSIWEGISKALESVIVTLLKTLGIIPDYYAESGKQQPDKIGERQLHGNALTKDQIDSLISWRNTMINSPDAKVMWGDEAVSAREAFEKAFRSTLEANNFGTDTIDRLLSDALAVGDDDDLFAGILTDLASANITYTDQFAVSAAQMSDSATTTSGSVDALGAAASAAANELSMIHAPTGENLPGNAKGMWDVPFDNYTTRLHRDEMVLSASRAREYRDRSSGNVDSGVLVQMVQMLSNKLGDMSIKVGKDEFGRTVINNSGRRMKGYMGQMNRREAKAYGR